MGRYFHSEISRMYRWFRKTEELALLEYLVKLIVAILTITFFGYIFY
jgi:hypothetical protein